MTTNREWLYGLDVADLAEWFDAEHVDANDDFKRENDVSAGAVDANDTCDALDSREKLEADVRKYITISITSNHDDDGVLAPVITVLEWLNRQAAITEREAFMRGRASLDDEFAECVDEIAELTAQVDELSQQLTNARADCEQYRELLSEAITHAHEIVNLQP